MPRLCLAIVCTKYAYDEIREIHFKTSFFLIVSNPPPSPVGQEQSSPEYKTHEININVVDNADLPSTSKAASAAGLKELISYDDDILDVSCGKMDLF